MKSLSPHALQLKAYQIRIDVIKSLAQAGSGHPAGSLGTAELFTTLYFHILNHDPKEPFWENRDRFFLSAGHLCPTLYACLAHARYFPKTHLKTLRKFGSALQGHPERTRLPGVESTSGPLGCGLAQAAGYALAAKLDQQRFRVYCLTSDGEHQEGNHWEAVLFAAKYQLSNLTLFIDRNHIQISGFTEDVMPLTPLAEKYHSFGWNTISIDGHDPLQIIAAVDAARGAVDKPTAIIAQTTPGKGVSFLENDPAWHGRALTPDQADQAIKELISRQKEIEKQET